MFENWNADHNTKYVLCRDSIWSILYLFFAYPLYRDSRVYLNVTYQFTKKYEIMGKFTNAL